MDKDFDPYMFPRRSEETMIREEPTAVTDEMEIGVESAWKE